MWVVLHALDDLGDSAINSSALSYCFSACTKCLSYLPHVGMFYDLGIAAVYGSRSLERFHGSRGNYVCCWSRRMLDRGTLPVMWKKYRRPNVWAD